MTDLVALDLPAGDAFVDALYEAWDLGHAVLPLPQQAPAGLRVATATRLGARWLVTPTTRSELSGHRSLLPGDALVMATSGTTGEPKGVVLTHEALEHAAYATATAVGVDGSTHWVACLPLAHVGGLSVITRARITGARLTVHARFDPHLLDEALARGATHVSLVPTALQRIDPAPWRLVLLGGSEVPTDRPPNCIATYGMTETFGGVVYDGLALNGVEVRIADTRPDERDTEGIIQVRSPTLLRCYRGPDGRADEDPVDPDGWFTTGDIGMIASRDGRLEVRGRIGEVINTGGEKVWPRPVEARLEEHPLVAEAAVVGRPDARWGELVTALVVPMDRHAPPRLEDLRRWVREAMPTAAAPKALELVGALPRTSLGKLVRARL